MPWQYGQIDSSGHGAKRVEHDRGRRRGVWAYEPEAPAIVLREVGR
jgi:hypothetical protein